MNVRMLIADDEPGIVAGLEFLFRRAGFNVQTVADGSYVVDLVAQFRPAVLLLDVMLPGRSGLDICRALRSDPGNAFLRIVMLSARGRSVESQSGVNAGADAYVTKPFSTRDLMATVQAVLDR